MWGRGARISLTLPQHKKWQHSFDTLKSFFSLGTHQSMKTLDSDLKVNRNIYPDVVNVIG